MNAVLTVTFIALAVGAVVWGFERYRSRFVKTDLLLAVGVAVGLLAVVFSPAVYDQIGNLLNIRKRYVTVSLLGNVALVGCVFYLVSLVRTNHDANDLPSAIGFETVCLLK